jgi:hypothetical protein
VRPVYTARFNDDGGIGERIHLLSIVVKVLQLSVVFVDEDKFGHLPGYMGDHVRE